MAELAVEDAQKRLARRTARCDERLEGAGRRKILGAPPRVDEVIPDHREDPHHATVLPEHPDAQGPPVAARQRPPALDVGAIERVLFDAARAHPHQAADVFALGGLVVDLVVPGDDIACAGGEPGEAVLVAQPHEVVVREVLERGRAPEGGAVPWDPHRSEDDRRLHVAHRPGFARGFAAAPDPLALPRPDEPGGHGGGLDVHGADPAGRGPTPSRASSSRTSAAAQSRAPRKRYRTCPSRSMMKEVG